MGPDRHGRHLQFRGGPVHAVQADFWGARDGALAGAKRLLGTGPAGDTADGLCVKVRP